MTVCIAAMAHEYIVSASDMMISGETISTDGNYTKQEGLGRDWAVMMSGNDISHASPIIARAARYFEGADNTLESIRSCVKRAFHERLVEIATDRVLSRFGLDMQAFQLTGRKRFDAGTFAALCGEIQIVNLGSLALLVYGFDGDGTPHIFTVTDPGEDMVFDKPGFCAIGSGGLASDTMLYYFNQRREKTLEETLFNVCAAKFMAERAGVGRETHFFVSKRGCGAFSCKAGLIEAIRSEWERFGAPRLSDVAIGIIKEADIRCGSLATLLAQPVQ